MTFPRVNPAPGWAANDKLTSVQMNSLDTDHSNAADKSVAGDTVAGVWTFSTSGSGININGGVIGPVTGGLIVAAALGALTTTVPGAISIRNTGDFPIFSATRSRTVWIAGDVCEGLISDAQYVQGTLPNKWVFPGAGGSPNLGQSAMIPNNATMTGNPWVYYWPIKLPHNGATLNSITVSLQPVTHAGLPSIMPAVGLFRSSNAGVTAALSSGTFVVDSSATVGAYNALHTITQTTNQNNTVDTSQFNYYLAIWDESGTNALNGSSWFGAAISYTNIANMAFP